MRFDLLVALCLDYFEYVVCATLGLDLSLSLLFLVTLCVLLYLVISYLCDLLCLFCCGAACCVFAFI